MLSLASQRAVKERMEYDYRNEFFSMPYNSTSAFYTSMNIMGGLYAQELSYELFVVTEIY